MPTCITINISINRSLSTLQNAINETIALSLDTSYVKKAVSSYEHGIYTIEMNGNKISSSIGEMLMVISAKAKEDDSSSFLRLVLIYELTSKTIYQRVINQFHRKPFLRKEAEYRILDFKRRIEKWL